MNYKKISKGIRLVGEKYQVRFRGEHIGLYETLEEADGIYQELKYGTPDDTEPKVLVFDIETAPLLGYVWSLWNNNIALNQLHSDWCVLSWSAKWLDDPEVMYQDNRDEKYYQNDKKILKDLWKLLDEADIVITHNGKHFDARRLNARFVFHGMKPPSSYKHIDTKKIASKHFGFPSNKLEYLTDKLNVKYKKLKHSKFPGMVLWTECLAGNIDAWNEMETYNRYDVLSLEELYYKLIPWDNEINFSVYNEHEDTCSCGNNKFKNAGFYYTNTNKYKKYSCTECGKEYRDRKSVIDKERKQILKTTTNR